MTIIEEHEPDQWGTVMTSVSLHGLRAESIIGRLTPHHDGAGGALVLNDFTQLHFDSVDDCRSFARRLLELTEEQS